MTLNLADNVNTKLYHHHNTDTNTNTSILWLVPCDNGRYWTEFPASQDILARALRRYHVSSSGQRFYLAKPPFVSLCKIRTVLLNIIALKVPTASIKFRCCNVHWRLNDPLMVHSAGQSCSLLQSQSAARNGQTVAGSGGACQDLVTDNEPLKSQQIGEHKPHRT